MVFWLDSEVFKDRIGPEAFHEVLKQSASQYFLHVSMAYPVIYLAVSDRIIDTIARACCSRKRLVTDEEVEVLSAALPRQMSARSSTTSQERWLVGDGRAARS